MEPMEVNLRGFPWGGGGWGLVIMRWVKKLNPHLPDRKPTDTALKVKNQ